MVVQPVLQQNCVSCHGPEKSKGGLRLDSFAGLTKGGKSGPVMAAGKSADSELIKRIHLPLTDDDHMPPDGKPQPNPEDVALLQWWIDTGGSDTKKVGELKASPRVTQILASRSGIPAPAEKHVAPKPLDQVQPLVSQLADQLSVAITPLGAKESWLQCNASIAGTNFGDAELAKLSPIGANMRWLDIAGTAVTDAGLQHVASMPNLTRLHLERTHVTDQGIAQLSSLNGLEYLDLYGTEVTDAALEHLQALPKLRQLYLWQTKVTPAAAQSFIEARSDPDQLQRWREEIEQINAKIREARISVDLGTTNPAVASTNAAPTNAQCPVSGKPVDASITLLHKGVLVAFCCNDCKAKFQQDPTPYLAKLEPQKVSQASSK
jgi:hypothetical protein